MNCLNLFKSPLSYIPEGYVELPPYMPSKSIMNFPLRQKDCFKLIQSFMDLESLLKTYLFSKSWNTLTSENSEANKCINVYKNIVMGFIPETTSLTITSETTLKSCQINGRLVVAYPDHTISIFDAWGRNEIRISSFPLSCIPFSKQTSNTEEFPFTQNPEGSLDVNPCGGDLFMTNSGQTHSLWNAATQECLFALLDASLVDYYEEKIILQSPKTEAGIVTSLEIEIWDVKTKEQLKKFSLPPSPHKYHLHGSKSLLMFCGERDLMGWDLNDFESTVPLFRLEGSRQKKLAIHDLGVFISSDRVTNLLAYLHHSVTGERLDEILIPSQIVSLQSYMTGFLIEATELYYYDIIKKETILVGEGVINFVVRGDLVIMLRNANALDANKNKQLHILRWDGNLFTTPLKHYLNRFFDHHKIGFINPEILYIRSNTRQVVLDFFNVNKMKYMKSMTLKNKTPYEKIACHSGKLTFHSKIETNRFHWVFTDFTRVNNPRKSSLSLFYPKTISEIFNRFCFYLGGCFCASEHEYEMSELAYCLYQQQLRAAPRPISEI